MTGRHEVTGRGRPFISTPHSTPAARRQPGVARPLRGPAVAHCTRPREMPILRRSFTSHLYSARGSASPAPVDDSKLSSRYRAPSKLCRAGWFWASSRGDTEMVKRYIRQGQKLDARHTYGRTALFLAAELGLAEMVRTLLEAGANPNAVDSGMYQDTPLHRAAYHGFYSVVQALLDHVRARPPLALPSGPLYRSLLP